MFVARRVEKVHPMANALGTVRDIEEYKQQNRKQKRQFNKAKKEFLKYFSKEDTEVLENQPEEQINEVIPEQPKPKYERKQTPREQ